MKKEKKKQCYGFGLIKFGLRPRYEVSNERKYSKFTDKNICYIFCIAMLFHKKFKKTQEKNTVAIQKKKFNSLKSVFFYWSPVRSLAQLYPDPDPKLWQKFFNTRDGFSLVLFQCFYIPAIFPNFNWHMSIFKPSLELPEVRCDCY